MNHTRYLSKGISKRPQIILSNKHSLSQDYQNDYLKKQLACSSTESADEAIQLIAKKMKYTRTDAVMVKQQKRMIHLIHYHCSVLQA